MKTLFSTLKNLFRGRNSVFTPHFLSLFCSPIYIKFTFWCTHTHMLFTPRSYPPSSFVCLAIHRTVVEKRVVLSWSTSHKIRSPSFPRQRCNFRDTGYGKRQTQYLSSRQNTKAHWMCLSLSLVFLTSQPCRTNRALRWASPWSAG